MKIFDCVPFFTEFDQLRLRLAYLDSLVDQFIVVEARQTFTGQPKPLHLSESGDHALLNHPKLRIHTVDFPRGLTNWGREQFQREAIGEALKACGAQAQDMILVSDVDEIPSRTAITHAREYLDACRERTLIIFEQRLFYFRMNYELVWSRKAPWLGTVAALYSHAPSINGLRTTGRKVRGKEYLGFDKGAKVFQMPEGGWHFSYLGDDSALDRKLAAFAHQEASVQARRGASVQAIIDARASLYPRKSVQEVWAVVEPKAVGIDPEIVAAAGVAHLYQSPYDDITSILGRIRKVVLARRFRLGQLAMGFAGDSPWPRLQQFES